MDSKQKSFLRGKLFRHLDGLVIAPTAHGLKLQGVTDYLLQHKQVSLTELCEVFKANSGYLNVALRGLCSQGWLIQEVYNTTNTVLFKINERTEWAFTHFNLYQEVVNLLDQSDRGRYQIFDREFITHLKRVYSAYTSQFGITLSNHPEEREVQEQILTHIEGILIGPILVQLGMKGMFHKYFMQSRFRAEEFHKEHQIFNEVLSMFADLDWFDEKNGTYAFTPKGLFFAKRASAYGVTVSYIPTLKRLNDLLFGNPLIFKTESPEFDETHVNREMNVWGSGGAHSTYFKVVDEIIIELFNKPIQEQPEGILDMGCGNGAFLKHLFTVIETRTYRGTMLDEYPLTLIGADYNKASLKVSRDNLIQADIWAKIIWGDIGNPKQLATDLLDNYDIKLENLLNVRTFLDHNRIWEHPEQTLSRITESSGAYVHRGQRLNNNLVVASLKEHIEKWTPYVGKFGLLLIELHTVKPEIVAKHIGKTAATAYDLTHGYSDQYILELDEYLKTIEEAGLKPVNNLFKKFPDSDLATVSISLLKYGD